MKVLCIMTIYNEIDFLPYKVEWCRKNGLDLYVIDNYSTDYSYSWLKSHNIPCHQIDTNETFDLGILQNEIIKTTDKIKPDWVVYNGADLFIFAEKPIIDLCIDARRQGKNIIGWLQIDICNTSEKRNGNIFNTYLWYKKSSRMISFVYKWKPGIKYSGDMVEILNRKSFYPSGIMINYGRTKSPERRKELLKRRRLAWGKELHKGWGVHYLEEEAIGYKWNREELLDIRKSQYWKYLKDYV